MLHNKKQLMGCQSIHHSMCEFCTSYPFKLWSITAHHNFLSCIALSKCSFNYSSQFLFCHLFIQTRQVCYLLFISATLAFNMSCQCQVFQAFFSHDISQKLQLSLSDSKTFNLKYKRNTKLNTYFVSIKLAKLNFFCCLNI